MKRMQMLLVPTVLVAAMAFAQQRPDPNRPGAREVIEYDVPDQVDINYQVLDTDPASLLSIVQRGTTFPAPACDPATLTSRVGAYEFDGDLDALFADHPLWQDHPTPGVVIDAVFEQRNGRLEFEVPSASRAASEAWRTWRVQMSSTESWKIKTDVVVPAVWTSGNEGDQIGVGLWVGKPGGSTVYEIDFSAHARGSRVVLAQNIHDRHGGDPNYVGATIPVETTTISMEVMYCSDDRSLSVYYDGGNRVDTQPIDDRGIFDWGIGSVFDVGMIGFAEGPSATSNFPYLDSWEVFEEVTGPRAELRRSQP